MKVSLRYLSLIMILIMVLPVPFVISGPADPFEAITLYLCEGKKLERDPSPSEPFEINKFGDWDVFESSGQYGDHNDKLNASLHLFIINEAKLEVTLQFQLMLDQDGDGAFEVTLGYLSVFVPGGVSTTTEKVDRYPISMTGNWSDLVNGTARLMVKQDRPYRDNIKLRLSENDKVILPYHQKIPYADAGEDLHGFDGKEVQFNGNLSIDPNGDDLTYHWDFNGSDGFQVEAEGVQVVNTFQLPGEYNVTLKVSDGQFEDIDVIRVFIEKRLPPRANAGPNITVDRREEFTLDGSASSDPNGDNLSYEWDMEGIKIAGMKVNHSFVETGAYNITLTVDDGDFKDSDNITVFVNPNRAPVAVPKLESEAALAKPLTFNGSSSYDPDGDGVIEYIWEFEDGGIAEGPVVEHTFLIWGKLEVILTVFDGIDYFSKTIEIEIPENKPPTATMWKSRYIYNNNSYRFVCENPRDPEEMNITVEWDMGDGTILEGLIAEHTYSRPGTFTVNMVITDELGGSFEKNETFEVLDSALYLPTTLEVNGNLSTRHAVQEGYYDEYIEVLWYGMYPEVTKYLIPRGGARYYRLNLTRGLYNISVKVVDGGNIDILLMDKPNKEKYASGTSSDEKVYILWDKERSALNSDKISFQWEATSIKFLVIGNNGKMDGGATPTGNVRYDIEVEWVRNISSPSDVIEDPDEIDSKGRSILLLWYGLCIGVIAFFVLGMVLIFVMAGRRKRAEKEAAERDRERDAQTNIRTLPPPPTSDDGLGLDEWMNEETLPPYLDFQEDIGTDLGPEPEQILPLEDDGLQSDTGLDLGVDIGDDIFQNDPMEENNEFFQQYTENQLVDEPDNPQDGEIQNGNTTDGSG
jgi:PKD repeat protein